ncbi:hypothetical protein [Fundidesulfovibrio putealis]|uniref:hypothetical protein n=1 Tax=Fundidesulfovibrio putealis TaxID=270496 RepID=UPI000409DD03|nr:hypothetical protein [Fundidesulfovibrio putealis]
MKSNLDHFTREELIDAISNLVDIKNSLEKQTKDEQYPKLEKEIQYNQAKIRELTDELSRLNTIVSELLSKNIAKGITKAHFQIIGKKEFGGKRIIEFDNTYTANQIEDIVDLLGLIAAPYGINRFFIKTEKLNEANEKIQKYLGKQDANL